MLRRMRNSKRSSSRMPKQNRSTIGRKISVEKLQDRKLMAADFGGFGGFYGPQMQANDNVAAQFSSIDPTQGRLNARALDISTVGLGVTIDLDQYGRLNVVGTNARDVVNLDYNAETGRIDIFAETFDSAGQVIGRVTGSVDYDAVTSVDADMRGNNDQLNARVHYLTVFADGGWGNDVLVGSYGRNYLNGGSGNDVLKGSVNVDTLNGGSGNDRIEGGVGNDTLKGGSGNDTIIGGSGDDNIYGEDGRDVIYGDQMFGENQFDGDDNIWGGDDRDTIRGSGGFDEIWGQDGDDWIFGGGDTDQLNGGDGADFISGGGARDLIDGGKGNDTLHGNEGNDLLMGGTGNDWLYGGDDNDTLYGGSGTDYLYGGANNDYLDGGDDGKKDHVYGQAGNDTFVRHKNVWTADDPDVFEDRQSYEKVRNMWFYDV